MARWWRKRRRRHQRGMTGMGAGVGFETIYKGGYCYSSYAEMYSYMGSQHEELDEEVQTIKREL